MNSLTFLDHILFVLLAIVLPTGGYFSMRHLRRRLEEGIPHTTRVTDYRNNMLIMWSVATFAAAVWLFLERPWSGIGIAAIDSGVAALVFGLALTAGLTGISLYLYIQAQRSSLAATRIVKETAHFRMVLPHTRRELRWFYGLSFTAGITEELLYRGFMITYLLSFMPLTAAIILSSALFACAHGYQGLKGAMRTFTVGLTLATIYALTGSILLPVVAHILVDVIGGRMIYLAYNRSQPAATPQEAC